MTELTAEQQEAIIRHEADIKEFRHAIGNIATEFSEFRKDVFKVIDELRRAVSGIGRTDTKTILSVLAVMFAGSSATFGALVVVGGLVVSPILASIKKNEDAISASQARVASHRDLIIKGHGSLSGALIEQETQLGFVHAAAEMRVENLYLQLNTARAVKGEPLLPVPEFGREVVRRVNIPGILDGTGN